MIPDVAAFGHSDVAAGGFDDDDVLQAGTFIGRRVGIFLQRNGFHAPHALVGGGTEGGGKAARHLCVIGRHRITRTTCSGATQLSDLAATPLLLISEELVTPTPLIGLLGHAHLLAKKAVAVVGARNASINGCRFARKIAADLGHGGLLVVSGMARGIDAAAHEGTIATGTLAVLGGGLDVMYPKEVQSLYERIVAEGALISVVPSGTRPLARNFPRRNRLISGIARGVVIVEASPRSGSLITARMAMEQGREVFAVPGSAVDPRARGTNHLIRQGAILTESAEDVFQALNEAERTPFKEREPIDLKGVSIDAPAPDEVEEARGTIEKILSPTPSLVDEIIRNCQFSPPRCVLGTPEIGVGGPSRTSPGQSSFTHKESTLIQSP